MGNVSVNDRQGINDKELTTEMIDFKVIWKIGCKRAKSYLKIVLMFKADELEGPFSNLISMMHPFSKHDEKYDNSEPFH